MRSMAALSKRMTQYTVPTWIYWRFVPGQVSQRCQTLVRQRVDRVHRRLLVVAWLSAVCSSANLVLIIVQSQLLGCRILRSLPLLARHHVPPAVRKFGTSESRRSQEDELSRQGPP